MRRALLLGSLAALTATACIAPPSDAVQIRRLVHEVARAAARDDGRALYGLHDPDFRAVCPLDRFRTLSQPPTAAGEVSEIEVRGVRGWATVRPDGAPAERRAFIRDAGRWYVYGDAEACDPRSAFGARRSALEGPGLPTHAERRTPNAERPRTAVSANG